MSKEKNITVREAAYDLIQSPVITEKATFLSQFNQYSFRVLPAATKLSVKQAVAQIFKVDVLSVNIINVPGKAKIFKGKRGQRSDFKKAIVRLKAGHTIDVSVGV